MGFRSSWAAVDRVDLDEALQGLGWMRTGTVVDQHGLAGVHALTLGRWAILFADGAVHADVLSAADVRRLPARTVFLSHSDTTRCNEIRGAEDDREQWSVVYDPAVSPEPVVAGELPPELERILERRRTHRGDADDDASGVVLELGRSLVGFRHDRPTAADGFHAVQPLVPPVGSYRPVGS
jgi:hypothetical protein